jgi:hypothetical protein
VPDCDELLQRARSDPRSLRYRELCQLAECFEFVFKRQKGSHAIYSRPAFPRLMNFQDVKGMAKPYQVRQLLAAIDELTEQDDGTEE